MLEKASTTYWCKAEQLYSYKAIKTTNFFAKYTDLKLANKRLMGKITKNTRCSLQKYSVSLMWYANFD